MTPLPWFKCYPRDFNEGMMGLSLEERGAYITLINMIYARGGAIPDDAGTIAPWLGCTVRSWVKIRAALIVKGKLFEVALDAAPCLMNRRAAEEIAERAEISEIRSEAGARGGRKRRPTTNKNNDLHEANAKQTETKPQAIQIADTEEDIHTHREQARSDLRRMMDDAKNASGDALASMATTPGVASLAPLTSLLSASPPCDWSTDVLPAIASAAAWHRSRDGPGSMRSWTTAVRIATENRDRRLSGPPPPKLMNGHERSHQPATSAKFASRQANFQRALAGAEIATRIRAGGGLDP